MHFLHARTFELTGHIRRFDWLNRIMPHQQTKLEAFRPTIRIHQT